MFLEGLLADAERETSQQLVNLFDSNQNGGLQNRVHHQVTGIVSRLTFGDCFTSSLFKSHPSIQHQAKLQYASERPPLKVSVNGNYYQDVSPKNAGNLHGQHFTQFNARSIPPHAVERLLKNYEENILPQFPCFVEGQIAELVEKFYNTTKSQAENGLHHTNFIIPLILAISSMESRDRDLPKITALAEALMEESSRQISLLKDTSLLTLQCLILQIQLALLLPYVANLWYLSGEAMRMAISLGLHQDPWPAINDHLEVEHRRRIFWVVSCSEVIILTSTKTLRYTKWRDLLPSLLGVRYLLATSISQLNSLIMAVAPSSSPRG